MLLPSMNVADAPSFLIDCALKNGTTAQAHINASTTEVSGGIASSLPVPRLAAIGSTTMPLLALPVIRIGLEQFLARVTTGRGVFVLQRPADTVVKLEVPVVGRVEILHEHLLERIRVSEVTEDMIMFQEAAENALLGQEEAPGDQPESDDERDAAVRSIR